MYPVLFRLGQFEITSFGALVALATLIGWRVFAREVRSAGIPDSASDLALYAVFGGFAGAKLLWAVEHLHEQPFADLVFWRGRVNARVALGLTVAQGMSAGVVMIGLGVLFTSVHRSRTRPASIR